MCYECDNCPSPTEESGSPAHNWLFAGTVSAHVLFRDNLDLDFEASLQSPSVTEAGGEPNAHTPVLYKHPGQLSRQ